MLVKFVFEKETKNAWRYRAADASVIPGYNTLYVNKVAGQSAPATLAIRIAMQFDGQAAAAE